MATEPIEVSTLGQAVADAAGVAYSDLPKPDPVAYDDYDAQAAEDVLDLNAPVKSGMNFVDPEKSTVKGQLTSLLAEDSPYVNQARLDGEKVSAKRGMLNSSMSAGASEASAIKAALPIAQQDAGTYAKAQGMEQTAAYQQNQTQTEGIVSGELNKQNAQIAQTAKNIQNQFTAQMQGASEANQARLADMQMQHDGFVKEIDREFQQALQTQQVSAQKADSIRTQSSNIMQNYQISVENMMTDPDFLNMGANAVNNAINQMQTLARNSIMFLGNSSGVDLDPFVEMYLTDISVLDDETL